MKARLVFEKFIEDSDPIADMNIGMKHQIKKWVETETGYKYIERDLLRICAQAGKTKFVKYLIDIGAEVRMENDFALRWASRYGYVDIVKLLLDAGANVHAISDTALRWASYHGHTEVVKLLLDDGADVHIYGDEPLRYAIRNGHSNIVKIIKDHIAKENI